jgi:DNA primase
MAGIPDTVIDEILTRVDAVDFIGRYLQLKRAGSSYKGLCPFHPDKDPSLSVSQEKGLWKCFGCGLGGNVITFIQRKENLDFPDAVRFIAELYQIDIPEVRGERPGHIRLLYDINRHAEEFFVRVLKSKYGRPAREYLENRGFERETIEAFRLGSGLPGDIKDGLMKELTSHGFALEEVIALGLVKEGSYGLYDAFRERLIIPIRDVLLRTIGFGARLIEGEGPKYINSQESPVFKKGEVLFGIGKAKGGIRNEGFILLVEGYTDVMMCHQHGLANAVASMGTALTNKQVGVLKRYSEDIILCFDADDAGQKAAERSLPVLVGLEMKPRVLLMPKGDDPDSILRKKGPEEFRKRIISAVHFIDFLLTRATGGEAPGQVEKKIECFRTLLPVLDSVVHQSLRDEYLERIARFLAVNQDILRDVLNAPRHKYEPPADVESIKIRIEGESKVEREFLMGLIKHPPLAATARREITPKDFNDPEHSEIFSVLCDPSFPLDSKDLSAQPRVYENRNVFSFVVDCIFSNSEREIPEKAAKRALYMLIERKLSAENRMLESKLASGEGAEKAERTIELQTKILTNRRKLENLRRQLIG